MKSIGGFYYVRCDETEYECKARGSFRKKGSSPLVGDRVLFSVPDDGGFCAIESILPRKNKLKRPALCNIDALVIVVSEETGAVSAAQNATLKRGLASGELLELLNAFLFSDEEKSVKRPRRKRHEK